MLLSQVIHLLTYVSEGSDFSLAPVDRLNPRCGYTARLTDSFGSTVSATSRRPAEAIALLAYGLQSQRLEFRPLENQQKTRRRTYTYGVLPDRETFSDAYEGSVTDGTFRVSNDPYYGHHTFVGETELWTAISEAVEKHESGDEKAGQWASDMLSYLGFEWV